MTIKGQLTLTFTLLTTIILSAFSIMIYTLSSNYKREEFFERLRDQAVFAGRFYFNVKAVTAKQLKEFYESEFTRLINEDIVIYNQSKEIIFEDGGTRSRMSSEDEKLLFSGQTILLDLPDGKQLAGVKMDHDGKAYYIVVEALDRYGQNKLDYLRNVMFGVLAFSIIVSLFAGRLFAQRTLNPIADVIEQVNHISSDQLSLRVHTKNSQDEIAELANTFNRMLEGLEVNFSLNKSFVQHASHELRTPLTAIRGQIEVAMMQERSTENYIKTLGSILEDIQNLTVLTNGLLELSQLTNSTFKPKFEELRMDALVWEVEETVKSLKPAYKISISFADNIDEDSLIVSGNHTWLVNCIKNLTENACKFSPDKTAKIHLSNAGKKLAITFTDNGIGIPQQDQDKIFEPFFRSENAMNISGHGIGLSLCKRIVDLHKGDLLLVSSSSKGTVFRMLLPTKETFAN